MTLQPWKFVAMCFAYLHQSYGTLNRGKSVNSPEVFYWEQNKVYFLDKYIYKPSNTYVYVDVYVYVFVFAYVNE